METTLEGTFMSGMHYRACDLCRKSFFLQLPTIRKSTIRKRMIRCLVLFLHVSNYSADKDLLQENRENGLN